MVPHCTKRASTDEQTHEPDKITAVTTALKTVQIVFRLPPEITPLILIVLPFYSALPLTLMRIFCVQVFSA